MNDSQRQESMTERAEEMGRDAQERASEAAHKAQEQVEAGREQAADGMRSAAQAVREQSAGREGMAGQAGERVADTMEKTAGYLQDHNTKEIWNDVETYVRKHPVQALAGAVVTGLLIGRMLR